MFLFNPPSIIWGAYNALTPLLPEVTRRKLRIVYLSDLRELHEAIGTDVLPVEYGGKATLAPAIRLPPKPRVQPSQASN